MRLLSEGYRRIPYPGSVQVKPNAPLLRQADESVPDSERHDLAARNVVRVLSREGACSRLVRVRWSVRGRSELTGPRVVLEIEACLDVRPDLHERSPPFLPERLTVNTRFFRRCSSSWDGTSG